MEMTREEILRDFKAAKDKREQVKILADLNLCKQEHICAILKEMGVDGRQLPRLKPKDPKPEAAGVVQMNTETKDTKTTPKPRVVHDWERLVELTKAVHDKVVAGEQPDPEWLREIDESLERYYPLFTAKERKA